MVDNLNISEFEYFLNRFCDENNSSANFHIEQYDDNIILEISDEENTSTLFILHLKILEYVEKYGYTIKDIMGFNPCTLLIQKKKGE